MRNFANLAKQAKQLQEKLLKAQEELAQKTVEASAGGGVVTAIADGQGQIRDVTIAPEAVNPDRPEEVSAEDIEMLQDLVLSAVNQAIERAKEMAAEEMGKVAGLPGMGPMNIPGLM